MGWLGLDIGGANLKAAHATGFGLSRPFALWRAPERLAEELQRLVSASPRSDGLAVTMTGELADCYASKAIGVRSILDAVEQAAGEQRITVYLTDGRFVSPDEARESWRLAAASNWRALAQFAGRFASRRPALLLDMGSTTADFIPIGDAEPCPVGLTDTDRLLSGELVYTGVERTPVNAVVRALPWQGRECPVAAELFATTADAYLLLGDLPEDPADVDTADGRPRTREASHARLARMVCADAATFSLDDAMAAAIAIRDAQLELLHDALLRVASRQAEPPQTIIISGQGEFLLRRLVARLRWQCNVVSLNERLGSDVSRCAPAHAIAVLANEMLGVYLGSE
jgi:(4-(4-[2-(gamma-L-glutamylamino)ethyl]phenoxymethyl)furan-2-yl)methanamine synthase